MFWSVNYPARAITTWNKASGKRSARLIFYLHFTSGCRQYCHVGNTASECRWGLVQDADFAGDLTDSKSTSGSVSFIFGSHTFVPTSWTCKKRRAVSHTSTEAEIFSLDADLRMEGHPALNLWNTVSDVLQPLAGRSSMRNTKTQKTKSYIVDKRLTDSIDCVLPKSHIISNQRTSSKITML